MKTLNTIMVILVVVGMLIIGSAKAAITRTNQGPGFILYTGAVLSSDSTGSSDVFPTERFVSGAMQVVWADGTTANETDFNVEGSMDDTNWVTLTGTATSTVGTSGSIIYNLTTIPAAKIRLTVTNAGTSGSTLNTIFLGKEYE